MCYEDWMMRNQVTEASEKARKQADKLIEKAKSIVRPERRPETELRPKVEQEETAA